MRYRHNRAEARGGQRGTPTKTLRKKKAYSAPLNAGFIAFFLLRVLVGVVCGGGCSGSAAYRSFFVPNRSQSARYSARRSLPCVCAKRAYTAQKKSLVSPAGRGHHSCTAYATATTHGRGLVPCAFRSRSADRAKSRHWLNRFAVSPLAPLASLAALPATRSLHAHYTSPRRRVARPALPRGCAYTAHLAPCRPPRLAARLCLHCATMCRALRRGCAYAAKHRHI